MYLLLAQRDTHNNNNNNNNAHFGYVHHLNNSKQACGTANSVFHDKLVCLGSWEVEQDF